MFTFFTDRDVKMQLESLAQSGFDPLSRTCRFMLTEEAHHMFVGDTGMGRIIERAAELQKIDPNGDVRAQGGIDLETIQKWVNYWFPYCLDLFGAEVSSNAADAFAAGIKGRYREAKKYDDHLALAGTKTITYVGENGKLDDREIALRLAMNEILRDDYIEDCARSLTRWNTLLEKADVDFRITLPHRRFFRRQGLYADKAFDMQGNPMAASKWHDYLGNCLPTDADRDYVNSLMKPVYEPGKMANWIAPPRRGINGHGIDYEYVRTDT
jgi:benzoyl-CoA 2,3-dioxygenase component B